MPRPLFFPLVISCCLALTGITGAARAGEAGSLFSTSGWSLAPELKTRLGYDSNIFARTDGDGDAFLEVEPSLTLARRPSLTALSFEASARATGFLDYSNENSIDPAVRARYRYPEEAGTLPTYEMDASFSQSSVANPDVGRRVRETDWAFRWDGQVKTTSKATLRALLSARRLSYREWDLNVNETVEAGLVMAFVSNPKLELGAGYGLSFSRSLPGMPGLESTNRLANALTLRGRGDFTPNLSGRWYAGLAHATYSKSLDESDLDVVAGADLAVVLRERLQLIIKGGRQVYFSPDGDATRETSAGVEVRQTIAGGFTATFGVQGIRRVYRRVVNYRRDNVFPLRAALDYTIRPRFRAGLEVTWYTQKSDWAFRSYDRTTISARTFHQF